MDTPHHSQRNAIFSEINITPLTDIFLVLLIIMMVVAPILTQARRDIMPPEISGGNDVNQNGFAVEVAADGRFYIEGQEIFEIDLQDELSAREADLSPADPDGKKEVLIRADKAVRSEAVLKVLRAAQAAHFDKAIVTGEIKPAPEPVTEPTP